MKIAFILTAIHYHLASLIKELAGNDKSVNWAIFENFHWVKQLITVVNWITHEDISNIYCSLYLKIQKDLMVIILKPDYNSLYISKYKIIHNKQNWHLKI